MVLVRVGEKDVGSSKTEKNGSSVSSSGTLRSPAANEAAWGLAQLAALCPPVNTLFILSCP